MKFRSAFIFLTSSLSFANDIDAQYIQKITFNEKDSSDGFYLAVPPRSGIPKGTLVVLNSFFSPDWIASETKLHNTAFAEGNDVLTVFASMKEKFYADSQTVSRINQILRAVIKRFSPDTTRFALAGFDFASEIALRYTELCYEHPEDYPVRPKAVIGIAGSVDIFDLWHQCERKIKKNYNAAAVGDAKYVMEAMTKEFGTIYSTREAYSKLTPFDRELSGPGNERFLANVAVRLYYDVDIEWQLRNRGNGLLDTDIPAASELISRLMLAGNKNAEFVSAKRPGERNNGDNNPVSMSIVDEPECIKWLKEKLGIFDPATWKPPYQLSVPAGWTTERFSLPPDFAPQIQLKGVEDLRFTPGWSDSTSEEHWSYAFLWWLEGRPVINATVLQKNLEAYYSGLVGRNIRLRHIPANKLVPISAAIRKDKTRGNDLETYSGTIHMLDYLTQKPILLNCVVHLKNCNIADRSFIFFEISPTNSTNNIWDQFEKINDSLDCIGRK